MRKRRGVLVAVLVVAMVMGLGGPEAIRQNGGRGSTPGPSGLLSWLAQATRHLVDAKPGPAKPEPVSVGLAMDQRPPVGKAWPAQERVAELTDRRTANARFYQLSDGRVQAEVFANAVHYRDAQGNYQAIDTRVGSVDRADFAAGNTTNTFTSLFGASSDRLVRVEQGGRFIEFGLPGTASPVQPAVDGSTVTYAGAAGGADLVYDVTSSALKEKLVLRQAPAAAPSYTFSLRTGDLVARQQPDGSIAFSRPGGGRPNFVMPAPFMFDGKDDPSSPYGKVFSDKVSQLVRQVDGETTVTVFADSSWLADPARVYPVVIDPTIRIQPVPVDGQDVQIYSGSTTRNYNDTYQLKVGTDSSRVYRTLVQFPLTGVPANTVLDDARLELYYDQTHTTSSFDVAMEARRVTAAWDESTATWANMNANVAGQPAANVVQVDDGDPGTAVVGTWPYSTNNKLTGKAVNGDYRYNNDTPTGATHTWVPTITESGDYQVELHFVASSDRATNAPVTVNFDGGSQNYLVDQTGNDIGEWKTLGVHHFVAGTTGSVVLGDVSGKAVIADAVRLTRWGVDTKKQDVSSVWSSFPVRNVVQDWVNGTQPNDGFMVKAVDEGDLGRGGPIFEASEYAYMNDRRDFNLPRLVLTWGRPGVAVNPPTTVTATGALVDWPAYVDPSGSSGDDIVEYQVHRSIYQTFTPSASTLVAPVPPGTLSYQDTTAIPTAANETDPLKRQFYYYMVAVKTADGQLIPGPTQSVMLPKAGRITKIYRSGVTDTTLSGTQPDLNVDVYAGDPYVSPGNNSSLYGDTRGLVKFPSLDGIPSTAQITDAQLRMWNTSLFPGTDTDEFVDVYKLTRAFDETTASWNRADATTPWMAPGGDYDTLWSSGFNGFTNDPEWETWDVAKPVTDWLADPSSNYGLLLRQRDEINQTARAMLLSADAPEPLLRPTLEVTYLEPTAQSTYYAPTTPALTAPASTYTVPVSVSNPTQTTFTAADWELSYQWARADGSPATDSTNQVATALPADITPGTTVDISAQLKTPASTTEGNKRTDYVLGWELHNKTTGQWLSQTTPITALAQNVAVQEPTSDQLGLEKFYAYSGTPTGAGSALMNNLYSGNTVWSYDAFSNPSRGLSTFVRLAYNSLDTSDTVAGFGFSLQASTLTRLGTPLDFHPNPNPTTVSLTDGDGTTHTFNWDATAGEWISPKGVHLYLQRLVACDNKTQESRAWIMTRPDRTRFYFDCDGYLSAVADNNGNELLFTYEQRRSNNKPTKFLTYLTDPAGRRTLSIDYYAKGDAYDYIDDTTWTRQSATNLTNPHIIDHVKQITDIAGRTLTFAYTDKGLLGELIDGAGSTNGAPKLFAFRYDMTQGNKNVKLVRVTDPRGNATTLDYYSPPQDDPKFHWTTKTYTDRLGNPIQFAYTDPDGPQGNTIHTSVTDPENHTTAYDLDGFGRSTQMVDAKNRTTTLGWDDDHNVIRLQEANGAVWNWTYDQKTGYPTEIKDAEAVRNGTAGAVLAYQRQLNGHVADLTDKTSPEGRKWTFTYTLEGDLASVVDPLGNTTPDPDDFTTTYTYDDFGQRLTATDAKGNTTTNSDFDANGLSRTITDALSRSTHLLYDERGQLTKVTDALGKDTTQTYDTFGRPLLLTVPKDQAAGTFIVTPASVYDANDNITASTRPNGAVTTAAYDGADQLISMDVPVDQAGDPQRRTTFTYDTVGNLVTTTEPNGNLTPDAGDFTTTNTYDEIYQLTHVTNAAGQRISYEYDNVGNVVTVVDPRKNATADTADYTTKYTYDLAHRRTTTTDALGKSTTTTYDRDGLVTAGTDELGNTTQISLDARGKPVELKVPHSNDGGTISYRTTRYEYDEAGNTTREISPRGVATSDDPDDFATVAIYDQLNRITETRTAFDRDDPRYNTPDSTVYSYDEVGRLIRLSAPPSAGQAVRTDTTYTYFDNGWVHTSTDPHDIVTSYDYNELGQQTRRTLTSAGGSSSRSISWSYSPDGKLAGRVDEGIPVGQQVVLVDDADSQNTLIRGTWTTASAAPGTYGPTYATHPAATETADDFSWALYIPEDGTYEVFVHYPQVSGAATDAKFEVNICCDGPKTVDETKNAGTWVSIGSYSFFKNTTGYFVTLSGQANGTVVADAVRLVRNNTGDTDTERNAYAYTYDPNGNLTTINDSSPGARVDTYGLTYNGLNQAEQLQEKLAGVVKNTTSFTYNENGAILTTSHDRQYASYTYDARDLLATVTNGASASDPNAKLTSYTYTDRGERLRDVDGNGNTVDYTYYLDGLLRSQAEKKPNGTAVSEHTISYDLNGNRTRDVASTMNADNHSAYLNTTYDYTYDPRDRIAQVTKTGDGAGTESYVHDANNNVISQTLNGVTTAFTYDRDRLQKSVSGGNTLNFNYDPWGRLDNVSSPVSPFTRVHNIYDGFDHVIENQTYIGTTTATTKYTYDPLDRTTSKTTFAGTPSEKTTIFNYLGLYGEVLEETAAAGAVEKSYRYSPWGERLSQVRYNTDGTTEDAYYGYNAHSDVQELTDTNGDTKATYGYTAYGADDKPLFTGADKADDPTKEPYNPYRFNAMRFDQGSGTYDMGFRDYDPGTDRFLTRDSYDGALADVLLGLNPWTGNRYAFGGGNPISAVEIDGHAPDPGPGNLWIDYYISEIGQQKTPDVVESIYASLGKKPLLGAAAVYDESGSLIHYDPTFFTGKQLSNERGTFETHIETRVRSLFSRLGYLREGTTTVIVLNQPKDLCYHCPTRLNKAVRQTGSRIVVRAPGRGPLAFGADDANAVLEGLEGGGIAPEEIFPQQPSYEQPSLLDEIPGTGPRGGTGGGRTGSPRGGAISRGAAGSAEALGVVGLFADLYFLWKYGPCGTGYLPEIDCQPQPRLEA